jgi:CheY-like chemotaxis protein/HPt (histidine-containing phosphotransfer) domain-containing protein
MLRISRFEGKPFHIALLDLMMPEMDGLELAQAVRSDPLISDVKLVMLTSVGTYGDIERARQIGVTGYLTKPVRQSQLYNALVAAFRTACLDSTAPLLPDASREKKPRFHGDVLLAEDNAINRKVASTMLNRLGLQVDVAINGVEALKALELKPYDLILMDCQMPEMDGYEATRTIRDKEAACTSGADKPRLPIVALTAHAMEGDREVCLAAGMDDYLSKPFNREQLAETLGRWLLSAKDVLEAAEGQSEGPNSPVNGSTIAGPGTRKAEMHPIDKKAWDEIRSLEESESDDLLHEFIDLYLNESLEIMGSLREAMSKGDAVQAKAMAHQLKSSSAFIGVTSLSSMLKELEDSYKKNPSCGNNDAGGQLEAIEKEYEEIRREMVSELSKIGVTPNE